MFLLRQVVPLPQSEAYEFQAYDWGPLAPEIYVDMDELLQTHLLARTRPGPSERYWFHRATPTGRQTAASLAENVRLEYLLCLEVIRSLLVELQYGQIISAVYAAYPDWAAATVAPDLLLDGPGGARGELATLFEPDEIKLRADTLRGMREIESGQFVTRKAMAGLLHNGV